jgi:Protein of unknown function (DUF4239)
MLPPLGIIFSLFVAFTAAQVWSDNDRANAAVNREASALKSALVLATSFPGEPEARLQSLIRLYIEETANKEWPMMIRHDATLSISPAPLAEALRQTLAFAQQSGSANCTARDRHVA